MELTGKIIAVLPANSGVSQRTGNAWMSQEYVIEVPGQFPRKCVFRLFGEDRIKQFNIQNGEELTIQFDIDAHEYNGRWFNNIRAWNVQRVDPNTVAAMAGGMQPAGAPFPPAGAPVAAAPAAGATAPFPPASAASARYESSCPETLKTGRTVLPGTRTGQ